MATIEPILWEQLSREQQARIIALLVQILLRRLNPLREVKDDSV